uniref:mediator of RNA polymerase II transcription subunit 17-like n=1 Tax=Ciona intestinalis TaxID=7719 RepID=UPI000180BFEC|nr:mediator of RNA polymerase II transcription subunit 17-like [Ciona intestinalis]|eukprot:XP_026693944.1 mediator of RNA polymerase II transcription subunit 17-like [Ciona intestinalis]
MSNPLNVKISLQPLSETKIQEIAYNGRETFIPPLSMSESLTDLANRINFLAEDESDVDQDVERKLTPGKQWPWENIRSHLQSALIEMNVLVDVMAIAQNKDSTSKDKQESTDPNRYLMFSSVAKEAETPKPMLQMITKKRCLGAAGKILLDGAERLNKARNEVSTQQNFHAQLLKLRQRWRVRRHGDKILGDLSYRTAGSDFLHHGSFEVVKVSADDMDHDVGNENLPLRVVMSPDLKGRSTISVMIIDTSGTDYITDMASLNYNDEVGFNTSSMHDPSWHKKLCQAQNVLYCKELFAHLTKEAVQYKNVGAIAPIVVIKDTISTEIFPSIRLVVKLIHSMDTDNQQSQTENPSALETVFSLKFTLLQLLQEVHRRKLEISPPRPTSAVLGLTPHMRRAAVQGNTLKQLTLASDKNNISFIESLLKMAKHHVVRKRVVSLIQTVTKSFQDPDVQAHWSTIGNMFESSVRILIASSGFESCYRTVVQLTLYSDHIKALQREGRVLTLSTEYSDLYLYFITLISSHQLQTVQALSKILNWSLLHMAPHAGVCINNSVINRGTMLLASPSNDSKLSLSITHNTDHSISHNVRIQFSKSLDLKLNNQVFTETQDNLTLSSKYLGLGGEWKIVNWQNLHGRHFVQKMETLLTSLVSNF